MTPTTELDRKCKCGHRQSMHRVIARTLLDGSCEADVWVGGEPGTCSCRAFEDSHDYVHVYPHEAGHVIDSYCWCKPYEDGPGILVHREAGVA